MWLINVSTLELKLVLRRDVWTENAYAILSHTWEHDEVSFQDMQNVELARKKAGFWKIQKTCEQAKADGLRFAWVDTCCIDKTSSAELQEAINSMFEWYGRASQCYALITDVLSNPNDHDRSWLSSCRWFSRGWTLQELIAPKDVQFFDKTWTQLGMRSLMKAEIALRTGIRTNLLSAAYLHEFNPVLDGLDFFDREKQMRRSKSRSLRQYSIAQRMSWAAGRETTRLEDRAYSLLGIFGVTIPLLYGEGKRSFIRLQEEILRINSEPDLSLLLWEKPNVSDLDKSRYDDEYSLFAPSPDAFRKCGSIRFHPTVQMMENGVDMSLSSLGLKIKVNVMPVYDITSTIALKLVSQNDNALGDYTLGPEEARQKMLSVLPYPSYGITRHGAQERTIRIDIMDAQRNSVFRPVFMARHVHTPGRVTDPAFVREEESGLYFNGPEYIWLRFNRFNHLDPKWRIIYAWSPEAWDLQRLTFKTNKFYGNVFDGLVTGAIAFERADTIVSRTVLSFTSDLRVRMDLINHDLINANALSSYCADLAEELNKRSKPWDAWRWVSVPSFRPKSLHLYDGTGVYDAAAFVVKPEVRQYLGRRLRILQVGYSRSLSQFAADFDYRYRVAVPDRNDLEDA